MAGIVPITREYLREHYKKFPCPPLNPDYTAAESKLSAWVVAQNLAADRTEAPKRSDENFWKQRELCELIESHLQTRFGNALPPPAQETRTNIKASYDALSNFQTTTAQEVQRMVEGFLPQDFRVTMMRYARDRKEKANAAEVDAFVASGGTIEDKYKLLLAQQMQRRESLVQMANATGMWRALITWLGGVPPALLDFLKQLNEPEGPMEEYRLAYGPTLYALTRFAVDLQLCARFICQNKDSSCETELGLLAQSSAQYRVAVEKMSAFLVDVLKKSPFFIADPAALTHGDQPKEVSVGKWSFFELPINAQKGDTIRWEFSTKNNADISFGINFVPGGGSTSPKQEVHAQKRVNSHLETIKGQFVAPADGTVELKWDNSYSYFTDKQLLYKAELVPSDVALSPPPSPAPKH